MKQAAFLILIGLFSSLFSDSKEKQFYKDFKKFIEASELIEHDIAFIDNVYEFQLGVNPKKKKSLPKIEDIKKTELERMKKDIFKVYKKHFTHQEIKDLTKFYKSKAGKKMIKFNHQLTQDVLKLRSKWSVQVNDKITGKNKPKVSKEEKEILDGLNSF